MILGDNESYMLLGDEFLSEIRKGQGTIWKSAGVPGNEIWYKSVSGKKLNPTVPMLLGQKIISNIDEGPWMIITTKSNITEFGDATSYGNGLWTGNPDLKNIYLPESLRKISSRCFQGCKSLVSIEIPEGVREIGDYSFKGCTSLDHFVLLGTEPPRFGKQILPASITKIYVPRYYGNIYRYSEWGSKFEIVEI